CRGQSTDCFADEAALLPISTVANPAKRFEHGETTTDMTKLLLLLSAALMAVNLLSHSASAKDLLDTDELDKADIKR
uniref:RxLR effector protein n=1 Tax=Macrostomum lignano TaxID=282301 RepID=A0A1I8FAM5_9PLAT